MKPTGPTDQNLTKLIYDLKKTKKKSSLILAKHLEKSRRSKQGVNVSKLGKVAKPKDRVAVPGKVLAAGSISIPLSVYAYSFSLAAKDKIARAGGECHSLSDLKETAKIVV